MKSARTVRRTLDVAVEAWPLRSTRRTDAGDVSDLQVVLVTVGEGAVFGRGEAVVAAERGENLAEILARVEAARSAVEAGLDRIALNKLLPPGAARNALDCAFWELEARMVGKPVWMLAGLPPPQPLANTYVLEVDRPETMATMAQVHASARSLKVTLNGDRLDGERLRMVRAARPDVVLGVKWATVPNRETLARQMSSLQAAGVAWSEQPISEGRDAVSDRRASSDSPMVSRAVRTAAEVAGLVAHTGAISIDLDLCGGLTEGLTILLEARRLGFQVLVDGPQGDSLAMAPALLLGQLCDGVSLGGPLLLAADRPTPAIYRGGTVWCPPELWGNPAPKLEAAPPPPFGLKADLATQPQNDHPRGLALRETGESMANTPASPARPAKQPSDWFGQPRGLTVLFLTEMWEKFSFYGMRTLLIYYMTKKLLIEQDSASVIYGLYTAFVYFTPVLGGFISDRWLGRRASVIIGGSIMALGHFMMAFESLFYLALVVITIGNGLFLPSLPSQIRDLYSPSDPRKSSAYNVYYVGVNLGAFLAPLICGTLGELYGWHWGFAAAGIGMVSGLAIYVLGGRYLPPEPERKRADPASKSPQPGRKGFHRFALLAGVALTVMVFRGAYEQTGNTVALWADNGVDRAVGFADWAIPMTWFQSLNPLLVFVITPLLVMRWTRAAAQGREPSPLSKMALGAGLVGLSFVMLALVTTWGGAGSAKASWLWLTAFFLLLTVGELYILPVGLGLFGRLAPKGMQATMIAAWFFACFAGNLFAGLLGALWSHISHAQFFFLMAIPCGLSAVALMGLDRPIRRLEADGQAEPSPEADAKAG